MTPPDMPDDDAAALVADALAAWIDALPGRILVGFSGGLDSTVLLHLAAAALTARGQLHRLLAVHVDHGLAASATGHVAHCRRMAAALDVPLQVCPVQLDVVGNGLEAAARHARHAAFAALLDTGDGLLLGHHLDDQAETVLFRLVRGGDAGLLAGIPQTRRLGKGILWRPLLEVRRPALAAYAAAHRLAWREDPSNTDTAIARNHLRHLVLPPLEAHRADAVRGIDRSARAIGQLDALARTHLATLLAALSRDGGRSIDAAGYRALDADWRVPLLRHWIMQRSDGGSPSAPSLVHLEAAVRQLLESARDAMPCIKVAHLVLERTGEKVWLLAHEVDTCLPLSQAAPLPGERVECATGDGRACLYRGAGPGLADAVITASGPTPASAAESDLQWRARQGGEHFAPWIPARHDTAPEGGRAAPRRPLKKWLQDMGVPGFLRHRLPLLWRGDTLLAVPGVGISAEHVELVRGGWRVAWYSRRIGRWFH